MAAEPPPALLLAVQRLLRPLVRLLIANGVTLGSLSALLKTLYVHVAAEDFALDGKSPTDSRVSVLTGVHRKDVRRLRGETADPPAAPKGVSLGTQVVAHWLAHADFMDPDGAPRALSRLKAAGEPSFESLVEQVSRGDVRARSVLDELERLEIIAVDRNDRVILNVGGFVPGEGFEEKAYYFGRILAAHVEAAASNLAGRDDPFFDRAVFFSDLSADDLQALEALCRELGDKSLKRVNAEAQARKRATSESHEPLSNACFGVFFHSRTAGSSESSEAPE